MGLNRRERAIKATVIYLTPGDHVGDTLEQRVDGQVTWTLSVSRVRLWEQDAGPRRPRGGWGWPCSVR